MTETMTAGVDFAPLFEWNSLVSLLAILVLLMLSAFFSGSETALTAASKARMAALESDGNKRAGTVNRLLADQERLIGAILLGNNLANIAASAIATGFFLSVFGHAGVAVATGVMTALVLVFSEVLPKTYAILNSNATAMGVAPFVRALVLVLSPAVAAVQALVRGTLRLFGARIDASSHVFSVHEEIRGTLQLHDEAVEAGAPADEIDRELSMVGGILDLHDLEVGEVMVHRKNITMVDAGEPVPVIVDQVLAANHTRIPLWRDNPENIIGVLHAKDLLRALGRVGWNVEELNLDEIVRSPWFVPETTELKAQLNAFLQERGHVALVVDEYGTLMGLVTLEDIIEEIVGEIRDEHDPLVKGVRPQPDGSFNVDGTVPVRDLNRAMRWKLPDDEATTIAGLVIHEARMIPDPGQTFTFYGFKFEVLRRKRNQITAIRLTPPAHLRRARTPQRVSNVAGQAGA